VFETELEPGQASEAATEFGFPFDSTTGLNPQLEKVIDYVHKNSASARSTIGFIERRSYDQHRSSS